MKPCRVIFPDDGGCALKLADYLALDYLVFVSCQTVSTKLQQSRGTLYEFTTLGGFNRKPRPTDKCRRTSPEPSRPQSRALQC